MPPFLALLLTIIFCGVLLVRESRTRPEMSGALWIPVAWIFLVGSRFASGWLNLGAPAGAGGLPEDGSPVDAVVFGVLILSGAVVLMGRHARVSEFARRNVWLTVFILYCLLSIAWSDFPLVAFKRWIKMLGHPIMALIILTEKDREEGLRTVLARSGYLLIPLSVLFIKYFPQFGRGFDSWSGQAINTGVTQNKNELGYVCMVYGLFFFWTLSSPRAPDDKRDRHVELFLNVAFLGMVVWLLRLANSATSTGCTVIGLAAMVLARSRLVSKRFLGLQVVVGLLVVVAAQLVFDVRSSVVELLGRNPTLTDRTELWQDILAIHINPVLGTGFESFWLGARRAALWEKWWWRPNQAHNGYIETYLNLGWVGILVLSGLILSALLKARREVSTNVNFGRFRLAWLFAILAYNYTEATFKGVHLVWTMFHIIAIDYSLAYASAVPERLAGSVLPGFGRGTTEARLRPLSTPPAIGGPPRLAREREVAGVRNGRLAQQKIDRFRLAQK